MSKEISPGPVSNNGNCIKEAVCIHTDKIYDSCRDKECIEDLRVYLTCRSQAIVDKAINIKCSKSEIVWVYTDVEPVPFNQGYFTVDIKFFFKVTLDVFCDISRPKRIEGLATYDKKVVLFGSEGKSKIFSSLYKYDAQDQQLLAKTNLPKAVVEVVDPICLSAKFVDKCNEHHHHHDYYDVASTPDFVCNCFEDVFEVPDVDRRVYVTLGLFSIVKLERNVQLLIPVYDFCIPESECISSTPDDPCQLFEKIKFPIDEFFPPQKHEYEKEGNIGGCGCGH